MRSGKCVVSLGLTSIGSRSIGSRGIRSRGIGSRSRDIGCRSRGIGWLGSIRCRGVWLLSRVDWGALEGHISDEASIVGGSVFGGLETAIRESNGVRPGNIA